jgi:hypothetical protein
MVAATSSSWSRNRVLPAIRCTEWCDVVGRHTDSQRRHGISARAVVADLVNLEGRATVRSSRGGPLDSQGRRVLLSLSACPWALA